MRVRDLVVLCAIAPMAARPLEAQLVGGPFRVNSSTTGDQNYPVAAFDGQGKLLVVWLDQDLYRVSGQRYDAALSPVGAEFRVDIFADITSSIPPSVACDASGGCVVAWVAHDYAFSRGVFARHYGAGGEALSGEFRVNTATTDDDEAPLVAVAPSGEWMIVWEHRQDNNPTYLRAQFYASSGAPSGGEFRVNTYTGGSSVEPSVAASRAGFIVAWTNTVEDGSGLGVYAQRYDLSGAPVGGEFLVPSATLHDQAQPAVAFDSKGGFVVSWSTYQQGVSKQVHAQRFSSSGTPLGPETQVTTDTAVTQGEPRVARGSDDGYLVTWNDAVGSRGRFFSSTGEKSPPELTLPRHRGLAGDGAGGFVFVYSAADASGTGVFAQRLAAPPQPIAPETKVDSSTTLVYSPSPRVAQDSQGRFVVVWSEVHGQYSSDVVGRRFDAAGNALGAAFRVNSTDDYHGGADVATLPGDGFVVAWNVTGPYGGDVLVRRFDASGAPLGGDLRVNAATGGVNVAPSVSAASSTGAFVVAWQGPDANLGGIFARRFSSSGTPLGGDLAVNTTVTGRQAFPSVGSDAAGNFVVAWESKGQDGDGYGIYMRRFTSAGAPLTGELLVNSVTLGAQQRPKVGMNSAGDFVVAFQSEGIDGDGTAIRAQRYSKTGAPLGGQLTVNSSTAGSQASPAAAVGAGGDFTVVWHGPDDGDGNGIFGQRYTRTGERLGAEFQVNTYTTLDQNTPAVAIGRNLVVAWQSQAQDPSAGVGVFERAFANPCHADLNSDGAVNVVDVFYLINHLFAGGSAPGCGGDVNGDGHLDVADVFYLINYLFAGGAPPF